MNNFPVKWHQGEYWRRWCGRGRMSP